MAVIRNVLFIYLAYTGTFDISYVRIGHRVDGKWHIARIGKFNGVI